MQLEILIPDWADDVEKLTIVFSRASGRIDSAIATGPLTDTEAERVSMGRFTAQDLPPFVDERPRVYTEVPRAAGVSSIRWPHDDAGPRATTPDPGPEPAPAQPQAPNDWWAFDERLENIKDNAQRAWGTANIKKPTDILIAGPLGRRHDFLTFWPAGGRVRTGCFEGTLDEFGAKVVLDYGDWIRDLEYRMDRLDGSKEGSEGLAIHRELHSELMQVKAWRDQYLDTAEGWQTRRGEA